MTSHLRRALGIDFHILRTLLLRGWSIVAGAVMVLFVPHWFGAVAQGYYYTFLSLIAIQIFFELGMSQIIVQFVSHEAAHLTQEGVVRLSGERAAITRLASLVALITQWYRIAAVLFFLLGGAAGTVFFVSQEAHPETGVIAIWWLLVLFTAVNLYMSAALAILEGFGQVGEVARMRLAQSILGYALLWLALSLGAGLVATPVLAATATFYTAFWLRRHGERLRWLRAATLRVDDATLRWRRDIFPLQWRIALSWISGYLILQLLVPMVFSHQGATEAGRLGITLTIFNSLLSVGLSWVNARLPMIAGHIARHERAAARTLFWGVMVRSTIITAAGSVAILAALALLPDAMRSRFADPFTMTCLSLITVANCVTYAMATFVRAHREEPLLAQSLVCACVTVPVVYLGSRQSVSTMIAMFAAVILLLALPWVTATFRRYYRREL